MKVRTPIASQDAEAITSDSPKSASSDEEILQALVGGHCVRPTDVAAVSGTVVGELVGMTERGSAPLVLYPGQPGTAAIAARSTVDLHSVHVGHGVVLVFEGLDPLRPIIIGVLRESLPLASEGMGRIEIEADGERMIIRAPNQLVLTCGEASITLTAAGKILLRGKYIASRSTGINRITGGSIELN
jgi:hypothetical protein